MTDEIPDDLKPEYAPDPRSFRHILFGIFLLVTSPLVWEVGVAMDPTVVDVWKQWLPVAPFGQFFPSVLPQFLESVLSMTLLSGGGGSIGAVIAVLAPIYFGIGLLYIAHGGVWTIAESLRVERSS